MGKIINLAVLASMAVISLVFNIKYKNIDLDKLSHTLIGLAVVYFIGKIVLEQILIKKIKDKKSRYSIRKVTTIISFVIAIILIVTIWVTDPKNLLVAYGIVGAGIAFSLQDVIKNFVGGIIIAINRPYKVGDRIEMNSVTGDVMDIGILTTTMLELKNWIAGDQATGRIAIIPNGLILSQNVMNFTKDHNFIWDEISLPLTHDSNWKKVTGKLNTLFLKETKEAASQAEKEISKLEEKYYLQRRATLPSIYTTLTDNWIMIHIRYITFVRERRKTKDELFRRMMDLLKNMHKVKIASESYNISIGK